MKKILLVEDTADVLNSLVELLQMEGYEVTSSINGCMAFDKLKLFTPNLIITDLRMPMMDGFSFIEKFKSQEDLKSIPILIFSATATPENEQKSYQLGAVGYLKKPCSTEMLLDSIRSILLI